MAKSKPPPPHAHEQANRLMDASIDAALAELGTDPDQGLTGDEATRRLETYGKNTLEEKKQSRWKLVLSHFWGPIPWMIEAAIVLSAIARRWDDLAVITLMLLINGGVGVWHENKSQQAIEVLKARLAPTANVIREGLERTIDAALLVPGDIIVIRIGEVAPADARLLADQHVSMDESSLTGESLPVDKDPGDPVLSGTSIKRGAKQEAIVRELASMEEIAGLEVLCFDKTGTLTVNQLQMQDPVVIEAQSAQSLLVAAALTCEHDTEDPIDRAVLGGQSDANNAEIRAYEITTFRPFDPTRKRAEADVRRDSESFTVTKGAAQEVLEFMQAGAELHARVVAQVADLAQRGFRAIGVASNRGGEWKYLGLLPLLDPPRPEAAQVVKDAQAHGIDLRMITGDADPIGRQVAQQVGLGTNVIPARGMFGGAHQEGQRVRVNVARLLEADGFADVTPEDKFNIIKAFQAQDRIVGMTGDGVNDAPALEQADVGIAVAGATAAARAAASLVLTKQGLGVIVNAVEEARRIFGRMTSYAPFRIQIITVKLMHAWRRAREVQRQARQQQFQALEALIQHNQELLEELISTSERQAGP